MDCNGRREGTGDGKMFAPSFVLAQLGLDSESFRVGPRLEAKAKHGRPLLFCVVRYGVDLRSQNIIRSYGFDEPGQVRLS